MGLLRKVEKSNPINSSDLTGRQQAWVAAVRRHCAHGKFAATYYIVEIVMGPNYQNKQFDSLEQNEKNFCVNFKVWHKKISL